MEKVPLATTPHRETIPAKDTPGLGNAALAVEADELTRRFGDTCAVNALTLRVPRCSVYAFLGPNGSGKTTTIRMLLGLIRPGGGEIRIFGEPMKRANRRTVLRRVGAMVDSPSLYPHLTGYENLRITQELLALEKSSITRVLGIVRLENDARRLVKTYSQGMRQRLGIAIALLGQADLLVLDEPTNGLDPAGMLEIRDLARRLPADHGTTVFLSSHLLNEVEQIATHVGIIAQGRLLFEGTLGDLRNRQHTRVVIEVDDASKAGVLLKNAGWTAAKIGDSSLTVEVPDRAAIARAAAVLVGAGVSVFQIRTERPSLEEIFLDLTTETGFGDPSKEKEER
jgi:ABC-type multidrug transport system ATPase subunit